MKQVYQAILPLGLFMLTQAWAQGPVPGKTVPTPRPAPTPGAIPATPAPAPGVVPGTPAPTTGKPVLKVDADFHDFGKIAEDKSVTHNYVVSNVGTAPLSVSKAKASCGCTTPKFKPTTLAPGESMNIGVSFNPKGRRGSQSKTVTVTSNCSVKPTTLLRFKATIATLVTLSPSGVSLGNVPAGDVITKTVKMTNNGTKPLVIKEAKSTKDTLDVEVEPAGDGKNYTVRISSRPDTKVGRISDTVTVSYEGDKVGAERISVFGTVQGKITIPKSVTIVPGATSLSTTIKPASVKNFDLIDVTWPGVEATRKVVNNGLAGFSISYSGFTADESLNDKPLRIQTTGKGTRRNRNSGDCSGGAQQARDSTWHSGPPGYHQQGCAQFDPADNSFSSGGDPTCASRVETDRQASSRPTRSSAHCDASEKGCTNDRYSQNAAAIRAGPSDKSPGDSCQPQGNARYSECNARAGAGSTRPRASGKN